MITKIELGSFNRSASSPILLKEKIESDGTSSVRIYQRKDIDSINSFKDKIKTMMKYGIEDFCMAHKKFLPLLGTVGIKKIDHLQTNDLQSAQDLFQSIRSEARTGKVTQEKELKLKEILGNYGLSDNYKIDFYENKYKDADFFSDLKKFINSDKNISKNDKSIFDFIEEAFISKKILTASELENHQEFIKRIKNSLSDHFKKQMLSLEAQSGKRENSAETNFSESSTSPLKTLQKEIDRKLNEIELEIAQRSLSPKDKDIKRYLLSSLEKKLEDSDTGSDAVKAAAEIRTTIDILFSTSWWISEGKKMESLKKVQDDFQVDRQWMPESVRNRIYPEQETASVSPPSDPNLDIKPYPNINQ